MSEIWFQRSGGPGELNFLLSLADLTTLSCNQHIACNYLSLDAKFVNIADCVLSLRYADADEWQRFPIPDTTADTVEQFVAHVQKSVHSFRCQDLGGGEHEIWIETGRHQSHLTVEFMVNQALGAILGLDSASVWSGRAKCRVSVGALTERVVLAGPELARAASWLGRSEIASLGVWDLAEERPLGALMAHALLPRPRFAFYIAPMANPTKPLIVSSFRLLVGFTLGSY